MSDGHYSARAHLVYWNPQTPACRAKGPRNARCLLNKRHAGDHYGNGFDTYGPLGRVWWKNLTQAARLSSTEREAK